MIMSHALQDRDALAHQDGRCNAEFNEWTEPLGSSADEMQKAYVEIGSWLNQVSASAAKRIRADSLGA
jgi:hypothetical protein